MKALLKFNLDEPEDVEAHLRCVKALDMALALYNIVQIRRSYKYTPLSDDKADMLEEIFEKISETLNERDINLDKLVS